MKKIFLSALLLLVAFALRAQIVTSTPSFPTDNAAVSIVFDATQGTAGLKDYTGDVYAHTGVITDKSSSGSDWKYAPEWGDNSSKYKLTPLGNNKWKLDISPSVREYYNVPAGEKILKMAFVFRSADKTKEGKDTGGKDIYVDVSQGNLTVRWDNPSATATIDKGATLQLKASASAVANLSLLVGSEQVATQSGSTEITGNYQFKTAGRFVLTARATSESETAEATQTVNVVESSIQAARPAGTRPGINYINDNEVTLVLQAPYKKNVYVIGDFNNWAYSTAYQMKQDGEYFWLTLNGLEKGKEYGFQYVVDGNIVVADPYADKLLDPWNDSYISSETYPNLKAYPTGFTTGIVSVLQTGQTPYQWTATNYNRPDKQQLMVYEMHLRDFTAEHTFAAAQQKITYLKALGVNAVELMPVNEFEGNSSWGYNPSFYFAPDKYYGPKNTMKAFVDACHAQGITVIMDLVLNHSYGQSPFYLLYRDADGRPSANNPWYNQTSNIPNSSLQWGYDFNHNSTYTRTLVDSIASYWMSEFKIDGFRYDFTKGFSNTAQDTWANLYDKERINNLERLSSEIWKRNPQAYVIMEHLTSGTTEEAELGAYGILLWRNMNNAYCESAMGWPDKSNFSGLYTASSSMPSGSLMGYMESHDEERTSFKAWKWGRTDIIGAASSVNNSISPSGDYNLSNRMNQLATNAAFFFTVPGPKMIWEFGELGYDFSINNNSDGSKYDDSGAYRTDPKPLHWDYYDVAARKNLYDTYARLLDLRNSYPTLFTANANFSWKVNGNNDWNNGRFITLTSGNLALVVVGNFTASDASLSTTFPKAGDWYSFNEESDTRHIASDGFTLSVQVPARSFRLFTNFKPVSAGVLTVGSDETEPVAVYKHSDDELVINGLAQSVTIFRADGATVLQTTQSRSVGLSFLPTGSYIARVVLTNGKNGNVKIWR